MFEKARSFIGGRWDKQPDFVGPQTKPLESEGGKNKTDKEDESEVRMCLYVRNNPLVQSRTGLFLPMRRHRRLSEVCGLI